MKFGMLFRLDDLINSILIFSRPMNFQVLEQNFGDLFNKIKNVGLLLDIYESISFKLGMMTYTTKLCCLISV